MYNQDVKGAFVVEITRDNITLKPRALHMAVGIAVVAEGIFVVVMVLRFRMSAINISEFFVPLAYSVVLITFGMYELDLGSKQLTMNSTGISCKSVLKRQYIRWTEVHDYGICYSGETRYKGATYNLYFSKNVQTLKNSRTKKLDMNTIKTFIFADELDRAEKYIIPFCQSVCDAKPFLSR